MASTQYWLHVGKTRMGWTYKVAINDRSMTLEFFASRMGLKYNSVVAGIRRRNWHSGMYGLQFMQMIKEMREHTYRGSVLCPTCNKTRIPAKYDPIGRGDKLIPHAEITWRRADGSEPVWTPIAAPVQAEPDSPDLSGLGSLSTPD